MHLSNVDIQWIGHAGFRLTDMIYNRVIYIDPFKISGGVSADVILITHEHFDHCSIEDLKKVSTPKTVIIAPADCMSKFQGKIDCKTVKILKPGQDLTLGNINIEAVPAYNKDKEFHPKSNEWVGYIVDMNSKRIYHTGDSDNIPEMTKLRHIDLALMPVSGTYVMTAEEAANAVNEFLPKHAIPMHYGTIVGEPADAERFSKLCSEEVKVEVLTKTD